MEFLSNLDYGVPWKKDKNLFTVICSIEGDEKKNNNSRKVRLSGQFDATELELILLSQQSREVYFYDLGKISSHFNEYLGVLNL